MKNITLTDEEIRLLIETINATAYKGQHCRIVAKLLEKLDEANSAIDSSIVPDSE